MDHTAIKIILINNVIELISKHYKVNLKEATKYFFLPESSWDLIDMEFKKHIEEENLNKPQYIE